MSRSGKAAPQTEIKVSHTRRDGEKKRGWGGQASDTSVVLQVLPIWLGAPEWRLALGESCIGQTGAAPVPLPCLITEESVACARGHSGSWRSSSWRLSAYCRLGSRDLSRHSHDCHSGINNSLLGVKNRVPPTVYIMSVHAILHIWAFFSDAEKMSNRLSAMLLYLHPLTSPKTALF